MLSTTDSASTQCDTVPYYLVPLQIVKAGSMVVHTTLGCLASTLGTTLRRSRTRIAGRCTGQPLHAPVQDSLGEYVGQC